jgi:hypothetical protein
MGDTILPEPSDDDSDQMSTKPGELQLRDLVRVGDVMVDGSVRVE